MQFFFKRRPSIQWVKLIACLVLCLVGGWLSGLSNGTGLSSWYPTLVKSPLTPPVWVFPLTWSILYILMGISLYLILVTKAKQKKMALVAFALQLFFNFSWSFLFFYLQRTGLALIDLILLYVTLLVTCYFFHRISKPAAYLLLPYVAWSSFALYLNLFIWCYNP